MSKSFFGRVIRFAFRVPAATTVAAGGEGKNSALLDKPDGTRVVGALKKGEWVRGLTGSVYISPTRLKVVYPQYDYGVALASFAMERRYCLVAPWRRDTTLLLNP